MCYIAYLKITMYMSFSFIKVSDKNEEAKNKLFVLKSIRLVYVILNCSSITVVKKKKYIFFTKNKYIQYTYIHLYVYVDNFHGIWRQRFLQCVCSVYEFDFFSLFKHYEIMTRNSNSSVLIIIHPYINV